MAEKEEKSDKEEYWTTKEEEEDKEKDLWHEVVEMARVAEDIKLVRV